jgi:hypothetical protein
MATSRSEGVRQVPLGTRFMSIFRHASRLVSAGSSLHLESRRHVLRVSL